MHCLSLGQLLDALVDSNQKKKKAHRGGALVAVRQPNAAVREWSRGLDLDDRLLGPSAALSPVLNFLMAETRELSKSAEMTIPTLWEGSMIPDRGTRPNLSSQEAELRQRI